MKKRATLVLAFALGALAAASCQSNQGKVDGRTFRQTFSELTGTIDARVQVSDWSVQPGQEFRLDYDLDVRSRRILATALRQYAKGVWVAWAGERLFDADGHPHQMSNVMMSTQLTTTGLAIESFQSAPPVRKVGLVYGSPLEDAQYFPFDSFRTPEHFILKGSWRKKIDESVPPGLYRPSFEIFIDTEQFGAKQLGSAALLPDNRLAFLRSMSPNIFALPKLIRTLRPSRWLPPIQVGSTKTPRLPWILFADVQINGNTGVVAEEDKSQVALSSRQRFSSRLIMDRGPRRIWPAFPPFIGYTGVPEVDIRAHAMAPSYLDFTSGGVAVQITTPRGTVHDLGWKNFVGKRDGGAKLEKGDFLFDFDQWGKYVVTMKGRIKDCLGRPLEGGGSYEVWVGRWLTYSSAVKPGTNFLVGNAFPAKLEVNPPCRADVVVTVDYYPLSDVSKKRTYLLNGRTNAFGYFFPAADAESLVFDQPGEYRSDSFATCRTPDGAKWYGSQTSAGVIEGPHSALGVHGLRYSPSGHGWLLGQKDNYGMEARYTMRYQADFPVNLFDPSGREDHMLPFYSGDVLYISRFTTGDSISPLLSLEPKDPALRRRLADAFRGASFHSKLPMSGKADPDKPAFRMGGGLATYVIRDDENGDMFPILSLNREGYHPFSFPETNEVETYAYFSAIRPGFSPFVVVADSSLAGSYWCISDYGFGNQFNAGYNGDMPNDIYRVAAGLVLKDKKNGTVDYATYASTIVVTAQGPSNNRVRAAADEPLFWMNGKPQWLGLAMATTEALEVGDRISLGATVLPAVTASVSTSLVRPDGRVETDSGVADRLGVFRGGVFAADVPGVYRVKAEAEFHGKTGDVFGSRSGMFNHYVVEKNHPQIIEIGLPTRSSYDVRKELEIPLRIAKGYRNPKVTYTVLCPGIILDEDEFSLDDNNGIFRFRADQFGMQFPNFNVMRIEENRPKLETTVFIVFYVEAEGADGNVSHDLKK